MASSACNCAGTSCASKVKPKKAILPSVSSSPISCEFAFYPIGSTSSLSSSRSLTPTGRFPPFNRIQKFAKSGAIVIGSDYGSLFEALAIDFQEGLGRSSRVVDFLAELEWQDWISIAMHDKDRNIDCFEPFFSVELRMQQQPNAWKEPIEFSRYAAC